MTTEDPAGQGVPADGQRGTLVGKVRYFQDFAFWEYEFPPDLVFTIREDDSLFRRPEDKWLVAPGYGEPGAYGNGAILLLPGEFERAWRPTPPREEQR